MARNAYEVIVKVLADAGKAVAEFDRAEKSADRMARKTTDSMKLAKIETDKFAKQATIAGGVLLAAGTTMALGLSRTVKSAQEAEAAQLRLRNTIQGSVALGPRAMRAFEDQAKAIQKVTVASDEAVMGVQSMLGQMGMTQRQVLTLTPLVVDLSRKMGVDFDTAAKAVGKAVDGSTTGLKRMGVVVDATKAKMDPFGATVDALRRSAGGFAEQEGRTFAGQMAILTNQTDELKESLGRGVLSVMTKMLPAVNNVAGAFTNLDDATGGTVGSIAALGTGLTIAAGVALTAYGQYAKLKEMYDKLSKSSALFNQTAAATPYVLAAAAGVIIGQKLGEKLLGGQEMADKGYNKLFNADDAKVKARAFFQAAEGEARKGATSLASLGSILQGSLRGFVIGGFAGSAVGVGVALDATAQKLARSGIDKAFKKLLTLDPASAKSVLQYVESHDQLKRRLEDLGVPLNRYRKLMRDTIDTNHDGKRSMEEQIAAIQNDAKALQQYSNQMLQAGDDSRGFANAQLDLARAQGSVADAQQAYAEAVKSGDPEKIRQANLALQGVMLQVAAAQDQVTAAAIKQAEAQLALKAVIGDNKKYEQEIQHLRDLRDAIDNPEIKAAIDRQIDNINALRIAAGKKIDLDSSDMMASLWRLVAAGRITESQLHRLQDTRWELTVNTRPAEGALVNFAKRFGIAVENLSPIVKYEIQNARAAGGPVASNTPYLVGERGPELFVPTASGTIVPNNQLSAGGAMGSTVFNINVASTPLASPAETGAAVVDALTAWQRRNGRLPLMVA